MTRNRIFEVAVLGAGPAGVVAALALAKRYRTVLVVKHVPQAQWGIRIEAVPATLINLLIELGIHPARIGVRHLFEHRYLAWESDTPVWVSGAPAAHIERPALDNNLFELTQRVAALDVIADKSTPVLLDGFYRGQHWQAQRLIDATGRRALTASQRTRPEKPWVTRTFCAPISGFDPHFQLAALPFGYAYRLGSDHYLTLGIAGQGDFLAASESKLYRVLKDAGASRLVEGLPPIHSMTASGAYPCSAQWSEGNCIAIGDAVLARDTLSSQGLANGISEAIHAAAITDTQDMELLRSRQCEQRYLHVNALVEQISTCHHRHTDTWSAYRRFLEVHRNQQVPNGTTAIREGRLVAIG